MDILHTREVSHADSSTTIPLCVLEKFILQIFTLAHLSIQLPLFYYRQAEIIRCLIVLQSNLVHIYSEVSFIVFKWGLLPGK